MTETLQPPIVETAKPGCAGWFVRDRRLRSRWRVLLYLIAAVLVQIIAAVAVGLALAVIVARSLAAQGLGQEEIANRILAMISDLSKNPLLALAAEAMRLVLILLLVWLFRKFIDKRSFQSLGFQFSRGWWGELASGFALMVVAWGAIFVLALAFGAATMTGFAWDSGNWLGVFGGLAWGLSLNIMVGTVEETDARGYILQNLAEGIRFWPAVIVSSAYFGALHLLNPGAGVASTAGIFFAGILLALGYYATGRLWFSIGMHAGWNLSEGPIFGFLVSGTRMGGLFDVRVIGPDWLMGGAFGPEAGVLAVAIEIVLIALLFGWVRTRRQELVQV